MPPLAKKAGLIKALFIGVLAAPASVPAQAVSSHSDSPLSPPSSGSPASSWVSPIGGGKTPHASPSAGDFDDALSTPPLPETTGVYEAAATVRSSKSSGQQDPGPREKAELPRLSPPSQAVQEGGTSGGLHGLPSLLTMGSSLAIVLGLFFLFAWTLRRGPPGGAAMLPTEVVEVLGRVPWTHRQQLHLLRCGTKLVLVNVAPEGVETLTEITEPEEVDRLLGLCRQTHPQSASAAFRQMLQQFAGERRNPDFPMRSAEENPSLANPGLGRIHRPLRDADA